MALLLLASASAAGCNAEFLSGERSRDRSSALLAGDGGADYVPGQEYDSGPCQEIETCDDGLDNDCNGATDCLDPNCGRDPACESCEPEQCGNRFDDDCDGQADCNDSDCAESPACLDRCEDEIGSNCSDDPGYGDRCAPDQNTRGCSPERFNAWCNRRNPAHDYDGDGEVDIWMNFLRDWVDAHCDGAVTLTSARYADYICTDSSGITYACQTPLVLVFDVATSVSFTPFAEGDAQVDLSAANDGTETRSDWPTAATPWVALDRNGDGRIGSGRELFGSATLVDGAPAANGFDALVALDADHDGDVDADDPAFAELVAWADENGDRVSTPDELRPIASLGVTSLGVSYTDVPTCDARGNCERERAAMTWRDARGASREGAIVDVHVRGDGAAFDCAR